MEMDRRVKELADNELENVHGGSIDWMGLKHCLEKGKALSVPQLAKLIACVEARDEKSATAEAWRLI